MSENKNEAKSIFLDAAEIASARERGAYVADRCGGDDALRREVDDLLRHRQGVDAFMAPITVDADARADVGGRETDARPDEGPGAMVGPYKLLQQIGEGGMGVVFVAEQQRPVRRQVALKVIKAGMDTRQVVARFEAERQALALMDHPNIAKVLDAGATDSGRPYFVMELVKGLPITAYCDAQRLTPGDRLGLFVQVCQAVQHAHTKGIIHRDLKPSNVLVVLYDGTPVPKVIDFGVAKATGGRLTEHTLFTGFGSVVGTPEYMSPEQAELNQLDVDTRSDVYSLGVILYELLTGSTPVERGRFKEAALLEVLRVVREEEAPRPSTRLSTTDRLASIAACRGLEPKKLGGLVRGELDWIVMRCLEKDRARRYETASGLAKDVGRYLKDEAVQACPPSAGYRFGKFARRNKGALAVVGLVLSFLVLLGIGAGWAVRDRVAREERTRRERTARQEKVSGQLEMILDEVARLQQAQQWPEALASARRAEPALAAGEAPPAIQERARQAVADLDLVRRLDEIRARAGTVWVTSNELIPTASRTDQEYTVAFRQAGIDVDALPADEAADWISARRPIAAALLPALDDWVAVRTLGKDEAATRRLVEVLRRADPDPWRRRLRVVLADKDWSALDQLVTAADLDRQPAATLTFLYSALWASGRHREQELVLRRAQWRYPGDYWINLRLGTDLVWRHAPDDIREGIGFLRAAAALRPRSAAPFMLLGVGHKNLGQRGYAISYYRLSIQRAPQSPGAYVNLGNLLRQRPGSHDAALSAYAQAIRLSPNDPHSLAMAHANLAWLLANSPDVDRRKPDEAVELAKQAIEAYPGNSGFWSALGGASYRAEEWNGAIEALTKSEGLEPYRSTTCENALFLAMTHWQLGRRDEARRWYAEADEWMKKQQSEDTELHRLRAEAAALTGITDGKSPTEPTLK